MTFYLKKNYITAVSTTIIAKKIFLSNIKLIVLTIQHNFTIKYNHSIQYYNKIQPIKTQT